MKIKKLFIKNIRSYESQEIEFPAGALLLSGNVGSGKTTLLLAMEYALFGLQAGQKASALLRNNSDEAEVRLEIELDEDIIIIERKLKRDSRSITSDYSALTINGNKIECSTTELKTKLLEIMGYPQEFVKKNNILYKYTVYTPQEQMKQIITEDAETRLSVIRHVFGVDKYKTIRDNLSILIAYVKDEAKILNVEVKTIESDQLSLSAIKERVSALEKSIKETQDLIKEKISVRKGLEKEFQSFEDKIKEKDQYEKEIEKSALLISAKKEALSSLEVESNNLKKSLSESSHPFSQAEYDQLLISLTSKKALIESLNANYYSALNSIKSLDKNLLELKTKKERFFSITVCPTCLQDVRENHRHNILNESESKIADITKQKNSLENESSSLQNQISLEKYSLLSLESRKTELEHLRSKSQYLDISKKKLQETEKTIQLLIKDVDLLLEHHSYLKEQTLKLSPIAQQAKKKSEELKQAFVDEKNAEIRQAELNKEASMTKKEIENLYQIISRKEEKSKKMLYLQELMDWLSKNFTDLIGFIEIHVMMKLRMEFSKLFNSWFAMVAGDSFEVRLDENFTPLIIQNGVEMDYSFLSGGERTAVALAYRLALNQTINSMLSTIKTKDIIILDEPTDGFSEAQVDKIRDVLQQLNAKQLIIVSHEQKIESFVDHIIKVQKHGDVSTVQNP